MPAFQGRVWTFGDDINTDLIQPVGARNFPPDQRHKACFMANRPGWSDEVRSGDVIVAGKNFGCGSSRPAAQNFVKLGVAFIGAETVNGLFLRNSINFGLPVMTVPGISAAFQEPDLAEVDLAAGAITNTRTGQTLRFAPMPQMLLDLLAQGGLMPSMRDRNLIRKPKPITPTARTGSAD